MWIKCYDKSYLINIENDSKIYLKSIGEDLCIVYENTKNELILLKSIPYLSNRHDSDEAVALLLQDIYKIYDAIKQGENIMDLKYER